LGRKGALKQINFQGLPLLKGDWNFGALLLNYWRIPRIERRTRGEERILTP